MKRSFITGLIILLPLLLTMFIASFIINLLTKPFIGIVQSSLTYYEITIPGFWIFSGQEFLRTFCQAIILISFSIFMIIIGFAMQSYLFYRFIEFWDQLLLKIPLINKIYTACRDVIRTLFGPVKHNFGTVVLVPFPHPGLLSIGLITNEDLDENDDEKDQDLISVFLPTTPNPTMGFLLMYRREELMFTDMRINNAFKSVISCGVMMPHFNVTRMPHPKYL